MDISTYSRNYGMGMANGTKIRKYAWTEKGIQIGPAIFAIVSILASGLFLFLAQREIPVGTAYAVWTGIGAVGTFILPGYLFTR